MKFSVLFHDRKADREGLEVLSVNVALKDVGGGVKKGTRTTDHKSSTLLRIQPPGGSSNVFDFGSNKEHAVSYSTFH